MVNSNITITAITYDINGNKIVKVKLSENRGFSIQTSNLQRTNSLLRGIVSIKKLMLKQTEFNIIENELIDYIIRFGSKKQRNDLQTYFIRNKV